MSIKKISVYLGSYSGNAPEFAETAGRLGAALARNNIAVIYGGANIGTMKALADGVVKENGRLTGVIPDDFIARGLAYASAHLITAYDLRERKRIMEELSDACIVLPGGTGTLDELFDYLVHFQLGYHSKPVFILNTGGFYNPLEELFKIMEEKGFLRREIRRSLHFCENPDELVEKIMNPEIPQPEGTAFDKRI